MSWIDPYRSKLMTPREAVGCVESGMRVYIHPGCAEPEALVEALMERAPHVKGVEVVHLLTLGTSPYCAPEMSESFRHNALFVGGNVREAVHDGRADYTPIFLGEVEALFESGEMPIDVAFIQVSPPDSHGYCSFGVGVETTLTAAKCAHRVVAQVNAQMPRTYGDSFIHVSELDAIVEVSRPLCEMKAPAITDLFSSIGTHVSSLIEDGSVLQCGIGGIPDAVLPNLMDRKDLGVHTELISDNAIPLIEAGVINGRAQELQAEKDHPRVRAGIEGSCSTSWTRTRSSSSIPRPTPTIPSASPRTSAWWPSTRRSKSTSPARFAPSPSATSFYSGFGGQLDFIRGAARSKGGKPIIALPSTAKNDTLSRIVPRLAHGAGVLTGRADVHYVVTEYGVAYLHGKTIRQRAEALIQIAHPKFRKELAEYCEKQRWFQRNQLDTVEVRGEHGITTAR